MSGGKNMNKTVVALISRGIDLETASRLAADGNTMASLQQKKATELEKLGLSSDMASNIQKGTRPSIPDSVVKALLYNNRYCCCVCRESARSIIIHHIVSWHETRNHSPENLAVLCLDHHDKAHSKSDLSINLTADKLRAAKAEWEKAVKTLDSRQILSIASVSNYNRWDYINHVRIFEIARQRNIDHTQNPSYQSARKLGLIDQTGELLPPESYGQKSDEMYWKYSGPNILQMYAYMAHVVNETIKDLPILNMSDHMDRNFIKDILEPDKLIAFQGHHSFKDLSNNRSYQGPSQIRRAKRTANGVTFQYTFDAWECTSSSSKVDHMFKSGSCLTIARVKSIETIGNQLLVKCSAIVVGTGYEQMRTRTYGTIPPGTHSYGPLFGKPASD
jgi:hypothetical protein